ncbi:MAG: MerR family transcriptional regulator [Chloroflexi bacterium]|nr:MerR family transcriptional regulator [Chloroflexota bacterium]
MKRALTIGDVAAMTGVDRRTIRYYESIGVLPRPTRTDSGYRVYTNTDVQRLQLIRRARLLDMSLAEARELVKLAGTRHCSDFQARLLELVQGKQQEVEQRIADFQVLKEDLRRLEAHLTMATGGGASADHTPLECSPGTCPCLRHLEIAIVQRR